MAKSFRLWQKKRGDRQTGSRWWGSLGEALFFSALFLFAMIAAIGLMTLQLMHSTPEQLYVSGWALWLRILIIVAFLLVGGGGFIYTVLLVSSSQERQSARARKRSPRPKGDVAAAHEFPSVPNDANITNSPGVRLAFRLPMTQIPTWRFLLITLVCIVSSSTASVLLMLAWDSVMVGSIDWLTLAFAVPAIAVSVASALRFVKGLTMYLTVGPTSIEISEHPLRAGKDYRVLLAQGGQMSISRLRLLLVCDEEATYRDGTDIRTESSRVAERLVFKQHDFQVRPGLPFEELCQLNIPAHSMHSFQSNSNSIRWKLLVILKPRRWPVIERGFPIVIAPEDGTPK